MPQIYVVRKPFRNGGEKLLPGTILESLDNIKLARVRLSEWKIVPIPKDKEKLEGLCKFFKIRLGVDLAAKLAARASKGSESAAPAKTVASIPTTGTPVKTVTKVTAPVTPAKVVKAAALAK